MARGPQQPGGHPLLSPVLLWGAGDRKCEPGATPHVRGLGPPPPVLLGPPSRISLLLSVVNGAARIEGELWCFQFQYNLFASFCDFLALEQISTFYLYLALVPLYLWGLCCILFVFSQESSLDSESAR